MTPRPTLLALTATALALMGCDASRPAPERRAPVRPDTTPPLAHPDGTATPAPRPDRMTPYFATDDGRVTLCHADCLDVLRTLDAGSVDAVVTDPPYGMRWRTNSTRFSGGMRRSHDGRQDYGPIHGDDHAFDPSPWLAFPRVVLFGANHFAARLPVGTTLVWLKKPDHSFGTFLSDAEVAWMKGGHGVYCYRKVFPPSVRCAEANTKKSVHPTQKPVGLMMWAMERAKVPANGLVLDPFAGSGTTAIAALRTGRRCIVVEREEAYCETIVRRVQAEIAQHTLAL